MAFTSDRGCGGGDDVWIAPINGGRARRLTYEAVPARHATALAVSGWSPDGQSVLYSTPSFARLHDPQLVLVAAFGRRAGECAVLPLAQASAGVLAQVPGEPAATLFFARLPEQGSACRGCAEITVCIVPRRGRVLVAAGTFPVGTGAASCSGCGSGGSMAKRARPSS